MVFEFFTSYRKHENVFPGTQIKRGVVALTRFLSERGVREASFRLELEAEGLAEEARKGAHVSGDLDSEGVQVELGVSEGLAHGDAAEFAFVPQLVVEKKEMGISIEPGLNMVQYKYTTYVASVPDVPDDAVDVSVGYVAGSVGSAGFWTLVPEDVGVPVAVVGAAIEDGLHDLGVGHAAFGLVRVFASTEPADGSEACGARGLQRHSSVGWRRPRC